jgi:phosphotriesterase-related protein
VTIQTVTGSLAESAVTLADGHAHAWIAPPEGIAPEARLELDRFDAIQAELDQFRAAGGSLLVDCQPGGTGRDANRLAQLAQATGVWITATTGFHLQKYYPPEDWLWSATAESAAAYFVEELVTGTRESQGTIRAAAIKVGYGGVIEGQTRVLMEAAAEAARQTGALLLFHTERGINVEALLPFFADRGVPAQRLYLCHVDKRPDVGLHRELAQAGVLLGYDTFARPRYDPERTVWPLLLAMVAADLGAHVAVGQDMALPEMWRSWGGEPGLCFLPEVIIPRLRAEGVSEAVFRQLTGANIALRLAYRV